MTEGLPVIHALWIGDKLGAISRSCLYSFVMRGHTVHLHTYGEIEDLPKGIVIHDANQIIPESSIFKHKKTGSYALFSDLFRYELLKIVDGIYVDCDVYCLKPLRIPISGYLLGYEEDGRVNGAVLALPDNSELLERLLAAANDPNFIPPWYSRDKKSKLKKKKFFGLAKTLVDMPWGVIGPEAISFYVEKLNLSSNIEPIDIFYPVHFNCVSYLTDPNLKIEDITSTRTLCVHLYNEMLKKVDILQLDPDSVLSKMLLNKI